MDKDTPSMGTGPWETWNPIKVVGHGPRMRFYCTVSPFESINYKRLANGNRGIGEDVCVETN